MTDPVEALRRLATEHPMPASVPSGEGPPVLVVGSGKGGVGKSVLAVLLAKAMADEGRRTLLLDGAQNLGNLHVLLGVRPGIRLETVLGGTGSATALLQPVADRLWLLPADSGAENLYSMSATDQARLHFRLAMLYDEFDAVVVDAGPGVEGVVRLATMRGTRLLVVTMPEPAALTDAYALIKIVSLQVPGFPIDVLCNRTLDATEGRAAFDRLDTAAGRFLGRSIGYLGEVAEDPDMRRAVRSPGDLLRAPPPAARDAMKTIVREHLDRPVETTGGSREEHDV